MSLTVLETAVVADSVADFSVSFKTFALVEMVAAMDAGDNGAGGKASAMVSGAVVAAAFYGIGKGLRPPYWPSPQRLAIAA